MFFRPALRTHCDRDTHLSPSMTNNSPALSDIPYFFLSSLDIPSHSCEAFCGHVAEGWWGVGVGDWGKVALGENMCVKSLQTWKKKKPNHPCRLLAVCVPAFRVYLIDTDRKHMMLTLATAQFI